MIIKWQNLAAFIFTDRTAHHKLNSHEISFFDLNIKILSTCTPQSMRFTKSSYSLPLDRKTNVLHTNFPFFIYQHLAKVVSNDINIQFPRAPTGEIKIHWIRFCYPLFLFFKKSYTNFFFCK
jgi:hypothetical protein